MMAIAHGEAALKENHPWRLLPVPMTSATIWLISRDLGMASWPGSSVSAP